MLEIKKVGTESIDIIQQLTYAIWPVAYKEILEPEQINYMLELMYSKAVLNKLITHHHQQFIIAFENDKPVGFACYSPKENGNPGIYRLHKIYLLTNLQGRGYGKQLLDYIIEVIKPAGATILELNVNRYNKALHFYHKAGFNIVREEDIDIGGGYFMNDYVMEKKIG
jgi:diamine N-acetyltransferase